MTNQKNNKAMHITLWIAQVLLAVMFIMAGAMKSFQPIGELSKMLPWVSETPLALVRFIGISELLGGLGLVLPALFRIKPFLTTLAAIGLSIVMVLASAFHIYKGEYPMLGTTFFLFAMAIFIAWGRTKKVPITAK
jgi:putative oxidoreductase